MYVAHLVLHDFRSYADVEVVLEPGATAFIGRNGQGKTNLVEAIDYLSRLSSHRVATRRPAGPGRRRPGDGAGGRGARRAHRRARDRAQPRPVQPGAGQPVAAAAQPRPDRPGAHRGLLTRGPDAGQGRPGRPAPLPRRPAGAPHAAAGRRTRGLRADPAPAQLPAQDRRARATRLRRPGVGALDARRVGLPPGQGRRGDPGRAAGAGRGPAPLPRRRLRHGRPRRRARRGRDGLQGVRDAARRRTARPSTCSPRPCWPASPSDGATRARPRRLPGRPAPRRPGADPGSRGARRSRLPVRATPATASRGRSRWRCGWRPTTCCAPTATTRC